MLAELQRRFVRELFAGEPRLAPYRENVLAGLCEALESLYPVCRLLVGEAFFRAAARRFAEATPSRSPDLNAYGAELAEFLAGFEPARELAYLPDVARLEWARHRAALAPPPPALELAELLRIPIERRGDVRFALSPGAALLESPHPIARIFALHQPGYTGEDQVELGATGGDALCVWRAPDGAAHAALPRAHWQLLERLAQGLPLWRAVAETSADDAQAIGATLAEALARGVFALAPDPPG